MTNRIFLIIATLCLSTLAATAQSWEYVKACNDEFLYGEGRGVTVAEADRAALNDLISKIGVHVSSSVSQQDNTTITNGNVQSTSDLAFSVKTYAQATLNNTEKVIINNEPDAYVGRWIRRSEISKIFEGRIAKVKDYVQSALKAERAGKIDVALKDLYWALALLKSTQYPNDVTFSPEDEDGNTGRPVTLMTWIPTHINEVLAEVSTEILSKEGDDMHLMIKYRGIPVNSIDYSYFDGRDWSNIYSAKTGSGVVELAPGHTPDNLQLRFECAYQGESHIDPEVQSVLQSMPTMPIRASYQTVKCGNLAKKSTKNVASTDANAEASFSSTSKQIFKTPTQFLNNISEYQSVIDDVISAIKTKSEGGIMHHFTTEGFQIYKDLIGYGNAKIVGTPNLKFYNANNKVSARGVRMSFSFPRGIRKSFVEDIIFYFNDDHKIDNITFGLGKTAEDDILCKGVWSEEARFAIMNFMENYQTAYALKRIDYIESIFDDDAVIITGKIEKQPTKRLSGDMQGFQFGGEVVKYNRHSKDSYIKQLAKSFASNEFINLRFADNDVRKLGKGGEVYAIQISQEYYSTNYGDKGYLFLMVDINDPKAPLIKVRTWQPEKDPNFGIYGPEHFK